MRTFFLLPRWGRWFGLVASLLGIIVYYFHPEVVESGNLFHSDISQGGAEGWYNEIGLSLWLIGQFFLAFSRMPVEDEWTVQIRLRSFYRTMLAITLAAFVITWISYDTFFMAVIYAFYLIMLVYNLDFHWQYWMNNQSLRSDEE